MTWYAIFPEEPWIDGQPTVGQKVHVYEVPEADGPKEWPDSELSRFRIEE